MRMPRWIAKLYADIMGYFWIPCPRCGRMFGGHEWKNESTVQCQREPQHGHGACCPSGGPSDDAAACARWHARRESRPT